MNKPLVIFAGAALIAGGSLLVGLSIGLQITGGPKENLLTCTPQQQPLAEIPPFALTPAPPGETPLQRWQRTKADYERASAIYSKAEGEIHEATTLLAIRPYADAETELAKAKCGNICTPDDGRVLK